MGQSDSSAGMCAVAGDGAFFPTTKGSDANGSCIAEALKRVLMCRALVPAKAGDERVRGCRTNLPQSQNQEFVPIFEHTELAPPGGQARSRRHQEGFLGVLNGRID